MELSLLFPILNSNVACEAVWERTTANLWKAVIDVYYVNYVKYDVTSVVGDRHGHIGRDLW